MYWIAGARRGAIPLDYLEENQASKKFRMKCLIRFTQTHETFRLAEIQALAELENVPLKVEHYVSNVSEVYDKEPSLSSILSN